MRNYFIFYDLNTIEKIINRWAPPSENNTKAYIDIVCKDANIDIKTTIDVYNESMMCAIAASISKMENGVNIKVDTKAIHDGWKLL